MEPAPGEGDVPMVRTRARAVPLVVAATLALAPTVAAAEGGRTARSMRPGGFTAPRATVQAAPAAATPLTWDSDPAVDARVNQLLAQMTTEEKADLATGQLNNFYGFYNNPITRIGIPAQTMADGPVGVRVANPTVDQRSTQLPSGTALSASFDTALAKQYGAVIGTEAFQTSHNVSPAPSADITRTPLWGRAFEGFGEDPLLNGDMAATYIQGVQTQPVLATI